MLAFIRSRWVAIASLAWLAWHGNTFADEAKHAETRQQERRTHSLDGYDSKLKFPAEAPSVQWKYISPVRRSGERVTHVGLSGVTAAHGLVFVGDDDGVLRAFNGATGEEVWQKATQFRIAKAPTVDDLFVYVGNEAGLIAFRYQQGEWAWTCAIDKGAGEAAPVVVGNRLLFSAYDGNAYALDRTDGGIEWQTSLMYEVPPEPEGFSSARARFQEIVARPNGTASDGKLMLQSVFDQSRVVAFDIESGNPRWSFSTEGWTSPAATFATNHRAVVGSQSGQLFCLDTRTGKQLWKFKAKSRISSRAAIADNCVYIPAVDGFLYCLNVDDGTLVWKFKTLPGENKRTAIYSFPLVTQDHVIFAAGEGQVYAVDRKTGKLVWRMRPEGVSEAYTNLQTDGDRLFGVVRPDIDGHGEAAVFALGWN